jgi:hypothetical protein
LVPKGFHLGSLFDFDCLLQDGFEFFFQRSLVICGTPFELF